MYKMSSIFFLSQAILGLTKLIKKSSVSTIPNEHITLFYDRISDIDLVLYKLTYFCTNLVELKIVWI